MKTKPAPIQFVRIPCEDKSIVEIDIRRHGKSVGTIEAQRHETARARNGNGTYCTGSWTVRITGEDGRYIDVNEDNEDNEGNEFVVLGFRHNRWPSRPTAGTPADVSRALAEAKAAATAWLNARPDYR